MADWQPQGLRARDAFARTAGPPRLFRPEAIGCMLNAHYSGAKNSGNQIWNLLMLQLWWEEYVR
jgi:hypothetical protein